jgi:hypothetical protein
MTEEDVEDYYTWDGTSTALVSSRTDTQPEEEDPADEGAEVEGGCNTHFLQIIKFCRTTSALGCNSK